MLIVFQRNAHSEGTRSWNRDGPQAIHASYSGAPFQSLLLSWNTHSIPKEPLNFFVQVRESNKDWSEELPVATWGQSLRQGFKERLGSLSIDIDVVHSDSPVNDFKVLVRGPVGELRRLTVAQKIARTDDSSEILPGAVVDLGVPERSQRTIDSEHSHRFCSPTSVSMVLQYLGLSCDARNFPPYVYDQAQDVYGNWSLNVAYAGALGFDASAFWLPNLRSVEQLIAGGLPVIVSHKFAEGQLPESPLTKTAGHLLVIRGFTAQGDVIVNDPAADPRKGESVRRVYPRASFAKTWSGLCYLIHPSMS
ncbi:MAG: C39 family peptidase [Planctomycetota bacterium]|nr:C39 family peptidase [Planctomycetota bacterium]